MALFVYNTKGQFTLEVDFGPAAEARSRSELQELREHQEALVCVEQCRLEEVEEH